MTAYFTVVMPWGSGIKLIKMKFKNLQDSLRSHLKEVLDKCNEAGIVNLPSTEKTADLIYIMVDGAYYYLSLISEKEEYEKKLLEYKNYAYQTLGLSID